MPLQPRILDYPNAQLLLIGSNDDDDGNLAKATEPQKVDEEDKEKETPLEELEKLEEEDEHRAEALKGMSLCFRSWRKRIVCGMNTDFEFDR